MSAAHTGVSALVTSSALNAAMDQDFMRCLPMAAVHSEAAQYDQLLGQSHACRGRLDLPERVVVRVTLGNIFAALTMLAALSCRACRYIRAGGWGAAQPVRF